MSSRIRLLLAALVITERFQAGQDAEDELRIGHFCISNLQGESISQLYADGAAVGKGKARL